MKSTWNLKPQDRSRSRRISTSLDISPITAQLLLNRGVDQPEEVDSFLSPDLEDLHEPETFGQLEEAVSLIRNTLSRNSRILIYGDYDVDGVTGAAVLLNFFRLIDRDPDYYVPDRIEEGFGLNPGTLENLDDQYNPDLLVTVDCGTSNKEEIAEARERGMDVIVLDHHEPPEELPQANAILNPKIEQASYPFSKLCASGISFKLVWGLAQSLSDGKKVQEEFRNFLVNAVAMVALGTIADRVSLTGENRVFAYYGLKILQSCENPGIQKLLEQAGVNGDEVTTSDVGYKLAPPLNAAGRLQESQRALDLFLSESNQEAREVAEDLHSLNEKRKSVQSEVKRQVEEQLSSNPDIGDRNVLVCAHDEWHPGVVGITASRISDQYGKPTVLIGTGVSPAKGSARSPEGFPLHEAFEACTDLLIKHGGHARAAGLTVEEDRIPTLRDQLNEAYSRMNGEGSEALQPVTDIDLEVFLPNVNWRLLQEIKQLAPFGTGNPQPVLATTGLTICEPPSLMGSNGKHLSFKVEQGGVQRRAVAFGMADRISDLDQMDEEELALAYTPVINSWRGRNSVELHVEEIRHRNQLSLVSEEQ